MSSTFACSALGKSLILSIRSMLLIILCTSVRSHLSLVFSKKNKCKVFTLQINNERFHARQHPVATKTVHSTSAVSQPMIYKVVPKPSFSYLYIKYPSCPILFPNTHKDSQFKMALENCGGSPDHPTNQPPFH